MIRLTIFELEKIWKKPSFLLSLCVLLIVNLFLMWYTHLPDGTAPPLSAYKAVLEDLAPLSEEEKADFLSTLKEDIDGICFVRDVQNMQNLSGTMGQALAEQEMTKRPGVFEKYQKSYLDGQYLRYTASLTEEETLIGELYAEMETVTSYEDFLHEIQAQRSALSEISIFADNHSASFANRNMTKSASDYAGLDTEEIRFSPSKGVISAMENIWTDLLMLLSVVFFVVTLIMEEKQKGLLLITRAAKYGISHSMVSKLAALLVHCTVIGILFYGCNLLYAEAACGLGDLTARLQSLAPYRGSPLDISILGYLVLSILTKALACFAIGTFLCALSIGSTKAFAPYLGGIVMLAASWSLYQFIPAASAWGWLKYLHPYGLLQIQEIYGGYLNLNLLGHPVSLRLMAWGCLLLLLASGIGLSVALYKGKRFAFVMEKKAVFSKGLPFRPHDSLFRHEAYKILIGNRALAVLLLCTALIGSNTLTQTYYPSSAEQYYQTLMLELEGELTKEKEDTLNAERQRFDEAFAQIDRIDGMITSGEISENAGESMKQKYYSVTAIYPAFERICRQYDRITKSGGVFLYDTGWLYLFGVLDDGFPLCLLLLSLGIILAFSNTLSMEDEKKSWTLIGATRRGRREIIRQKIKIVFLCSSVLSLLPWLFRFCTIHEVFPMHQITTQLQSISQFADFSLEIPIWGFFLLAVISQLLAMLLIAAATLLISHWRKSPLQALFFAFLLLEVPLILSILGLDFAGWFSVYPIYGLTGICPGL